MPSVSSAQDRWVRLPELRRVGYIGLAMVVLLSALALGGAHVRVVQVATSAVVLCAIFEWVARSWRRLPPPAWVLIGLAGYSFLQSLPLPIAVLTKLTPKAADIWATSLHPFGENVARASISLDPGASVVEAAKWSAYALAFCLATNFARRRGAAPIFWVVFTSGFVVCVASIFHGLAGATSVFGLYEAKFAQPGWRIGPFLNANCLAGYLDLAILCGLGLTATQQNPVRRWGLLASVALMVGMVAVSSSRGGMAALVVGVVGFLWTLGRRSSRGRFTWPRRVAAGIGLAAAALIALSTVSDAWDLLTQTDTSKLQMWRWVVPLVADFPLFGVGRGAFESAFSAYRPAGLDLVYTHPENIVAQWSSEWGVVVAAVSALALTWFLRPSRLALHRHPSALGAMWGVTALILQNFVDLGLELFAPMLALTVVCAGCWGQERGSSSNRLASDGPSSSSRGDRRSRHVGVPVVIAFASLCVVVSWARGAQSDSFDRLDLQAKYQATLLMKAGQSTALPMREDLRAAMQRHPGDPYFARLGALIALREGKDALPWISTALDRCPVDSRTHWILANALFHRGALSQALLEARLTAEYEPGLAPIVGKTVQSWTKLEPELLRAAPPGPPGGSVLFNAAIALPARDRELRKALLKGAIAHDPGSLQYRITWTNDLLEDLRRGACGGQVRADCETEIVRQASVIERLRPNAADASQIRARLFSLANRVEEAERTVGSRCPQLDDREQGRCWRSLLLAIPHTPENHDAIDRTARRLVTSACQVDENCEDALLQAGDAMAQIGEWVDALGYFERAVTRSSSVPALMKVVDAANALHRVNIAEHALAVASRRAEGDEALLRAIEEKRKQIAGLRQ